MNIVLDDIICRENLYPFTLTRSAADIRIGILTIRKKWEKLLNKKIYTLTEALENDLEDQNNLIPANIIPSLKWLKAFKKNGITDDAFKIECPFHIFQNNDRAIREDYKLITAKRRSHKIPSSNKTIGSDIFIEKGAKIEHSILNAAAGPIYIGKNAEVMEGCLIRGPFAMGEGSVLKMGTKIYGATTLGPYCIGGGEIKNYLLARGLPGYTSLARAIIQHHFDMANAGGPDAKIYAILIGMRADRKVPRFCLHMFY